MQIQLFDIDFFWKDRLFGICFLTFKFSDIVRSLFSIYWADGELMIDLFWFRVYTGYYFYFLFHKE